MYKETNIRKLLHRYMEGESTQTEMKQLKEYFDSEQNLPVDLIPYAQMFAIIELQPALPPLPSFCWHHLSRKKKTWQSHTSKVRC